MGFCHLMPLLVMLTIHCPVAISFISTRIINGRAVDIQERPYIISLQMRASPDTNDYMHSCGGSIISKDTVLTAAHCLYKNLNYSKWMWLVQAGSTYRNRIVQSYKVKNAMVHPKYEPDEFNNDYGLIFIEDTFKFGKEVQKICLATPDYNLKKGDRVAVSGWGTTQSSPMGSDNLLSADINVTDQTKCQKNYKFMNEITPAMICAGYISPDGTVRDGCYGDSGGPLVHNGNLVGVVSWGYECGLPDYPGVYARVSFAYDWIVENVKTLE